MDHLVYCEVKANVLEKLIHKEKTKIIRGASGRKLPYGRVQIGDVLYFVENDGQCLIKASAKVESVFFSEKLEPNQTYDFIMKEQKALCLSEPQIKRWRTKKFVSIIEVEHVKPLKEPLKYDRKKNMDDWITIEKIEDVLCGSSKTYESIRIK